MEFATKQISIGGRPIPFSATLEDVEIWANGLRDNSEPVHAVGAGEMLEPGQCIAGRQLLGWTKLQLSSRAFISMSTITKLEAGCEVPPRAHVAIRAALEAADVEFTAVNGGGAGVRLRKAIL